MAISRYSGAVTPADLQERVAEALACAGVDAACAAGIGCSGGPDSAALAHATLSLSAAGRVGPVWLVHIDHQLRADSAEDAAVVARLVETVPAAAERARVVAIKVRVNRERASLERAAREARYLAFERSIAEQNLACMLLAHTGSDQAETVLMRMIRGTGLAGLAGIPAVRDRYLRPWLSATRADILAYVEAHDLPTVRDPSNRDEQFFRNRVRHRWLPALRAENPQIDTALRQLAESARDQRAVLDFAAEALLARAGASAEDGLEIAALVAAPAPVTARALALAAERAGGDPFSGKHVRALQRLLSRPEAGTRSLDLPALRAVRVYDRLHFETPGETSPAGPPAPAETVGRGAELAVVTGPDAPYEIRTWRPGDRMRPARLRGRSRKLSDLFTDAKIPRDDRRAAVIVVRPADRVIVWAQHIGAAFDTPVQVVLTSTAARARNRLNERR